VACDISWDEISDHTGIMGELQLTHLLVGMTMPVTIGHEDPLQGDALEARRLQMVDSHVSTSLFLAFSSSSLL